MSTSIERKKVGNYTEAMLKMFDNKKYKSGVCGSATCEPFPVNCLKFLIHLIFVLISNTPLHN